MPKTAQFASDIEKLIMQATAIANIADNAASSPVTNWYVSLHTASPGTGGDQTTNEISYTGYARIAVVRTSSGWSVVSGNVTPVNPITFGTMTGGTGGTVTYVGIGKASSGTGYLMYFFPVSPSLTVTTGVQPILDVTSAFSEQ